MASQTYLEADLNCNLTVWQHQTYVLKLDRRRDRETSAHWLHFPETSKLRYCDHGNQMNNEV